MLTVGAMAVVGITVGAGVGITVGVTVGIIVGIIVGASRVRSKIKAIDIFLIEFAFVYRAKILLTVRAEAPMMMMNPHIKPRS